MAGKNSWVKPCRANKAEHDGPVVWLKLPCHRCSYKMQTFVISCYKEQLFYKVGGFLFRDVVQKKPEQQLEWKNVALG